MIGSAPARKETERSARSLGTVLKACNMWFLHTGAKPFRSCDSCSENGWFLTDSCSPRGKPFPSPYGGWMSRWKVGFCRFIHPDR